MKNMSNQEEKTRLMLRRFIEILEEEYGKSIGSDITVARAVEVIGRVLEENL